MPAFIKTPADEKKWNAIKHSVAKQRGKKVEDFTDRDWATVNAAWHKSEELEKAMPSTSIPNPAKVGIPSVKMPKKAKQPDPFGKPSLFFKSLDKSEIEEFEHVKHPTLCKLRDFLQKKHRQK